MTLKIVWLYAKNMNIYGDYGNILAIQKRAELCGIKTEIVKYNTLMLKSQFGIFWRKLATRKKSLPLILQC
jgi:CobQ-like glutamine amidotransferase family enzyme